MDPEVLSPSGGRYDEEEMLKNYVNSTTTTTTTTTRKKTPTTHGEASLHKGLLDKPSALTKAPATVWDDATSIGVLVLLYTIQGVPLGLTFGSVPFLLRDSSSYTDIGVFSFAAYPYSLKLLWSPIVDSAYFKSIGRRKSWIIPIQTIVGLIMIVFSDDLQGYVAPDPVNHRHNIIVLTFAFFLLILLVATQDIAVDGWAITMLSEPNRGLASTCQSVGQNIGFFMSYTIFLALSSSKFCNDYLRSVPSDDPMVTLAGYMWAWGIIMVVSTVGIAVFKHETTDGTNDNNTIVSVYRDIWSVIRLPSMQTLLAVLLTVRIAFGAADNVTVLKLIEKGFPRENMAMMVFFSFPFDVAIPIVISRWIRKRGNKPMHAFLIAMPIRVAVTLMGMYVVYSFPTDVNDHTLMVFARVFVVQILYSFASNTMFVSQCAFFAEICDPSIGGTYMTLMNTIANLGGTWPKFFILSLVDMFTVKTCTELPSVEGDSASSTETCVVEYDGFYTMGTLCAVYGALWYVVMKARIHAIQDLDTSVWRVKSFPKKD